MNSDAFSNGRGVQKKVYERVDARDHHWSVFRLDTQNRGGKNKYGKQNCAAVREIYAHYYLRFFHFVCILCFSSSTVRRANRSKRLPPLSVVDKKWL